MSAGEQFIALVKLIKNSELLQDSEKTKMIELAENNKNNNTLLERLITIFQKAVIYNQAIEEAEKWQLYKVDQVYHSSLKTLLETIRKKKEAKEIKENSDILENILTELD